MLEAIDASSIHVSERLESAKTTTASAACFKGCAPEGLHSERRDKSSLLSTSIYCSGCLFLELGAKSGTFIKSTTSS